MDNRPIGIFDSGLGGLTVLGEIIKELPNENYIYVGDTLRMPYGEKSEEEIKEYVLEIASFFNDLNVKAVVMACNTSAIAYEDIINNFNFPIVISVLDEAVRMTLQEKSDLHVSFIGTKRTVESNLFEKKIYKKDNTRKINSIATKEFAEIVERDLIKDKATKRIIEKYLLDKKDWTDILVLGCTHYPMLKEEIKGVLGNKIYLNPGVGLSFSLKKELKEKDLLSDRDLGQIEYFLTKDEKTFKKLGEKFLNRKIEKINIIDLSTKSHKI